MRVGKFDVSDIIIYDYEKAKMIMNRLGAVILRAEHLPWRHTFEYYAISWQFADVEEGLATPEYRIMIRDGEVYAEKKKREEKHEKN